MKIRTCVEYSLSYRRTNDTPLRIRAEFTNRTRSPRMRQKRLERSSRERRPHCRRCVKERSTATRAHTQRKRNVSNGVPLAASHRAPVSRRAFRNLSRGRRRRAAERANSERRRPKPRRPMASDAARTRENPNCAHIPAAITSVRSETTRFLPRAKRRAPYMPLTSYRHDC